MVHPFVASKRVFITYLTGWLILAGGQVGLLHGLAGISLFSSVADGLIYNLFMLLLGLGLWFPVVYTNRQNNRFSIAMSYVVLGAVMVAIWLLVSGTALGLVLKHDADYLMFSKQILPFRVIWGVLLLTLTGTMYYLIIFYKDLEENNRQQQQLRKLIKEAELKALKSQLNPHFLFNSLNSISSLTITDADKAREMIHKLSDFMRYSLRQNDLSLLPLKEEVENIWRYLEIERVRFGDRLRIETEIDADCYALKVPPMILQPLYENAVKHGVYESIEPVSIRTFCYRKNDSLIITVVNNYDPESIPQKGEGVGLENIRSRLRMLFHQEGLLQTVRENNHFEATLVIPQFDLP